MLIISIIYGSKSRKNYVKIECSIAKNELGKPRSLK